MNKDMKKYVAELIGTFWLVFGGCGSALLAAGVPKIGIGLLGVSLAFGLSVVTMAYAIGHISGCHLNPAVSLGLFAAGRMEKKDLLPYIGAQVVGGLIGALVLFLIVKGQEGVTSAVFANVSNGFGEHSPMNYKLVSVLVTEVVLTAVFLFVIMGATDGRAPAGFAPLAIGLALAMIHMISIPVSNTSVNPARSTATAIIEHGWALKQLWMFWVAPIAGGVLGALAYKFIATEDK
jgi:aquaporin Z